MAIQALLANLSTADWVFNLLIQSLVLFLIGYIWVKLARRIPLPIKSGLLLTLIFLLILLPIGILVFRTDHPPLFRIPISPGRYEAVTGVDRPDPMLSGQGKAESKTLNQNASIDHSIPAEQGVNLFNLHSINSALMLLNGLGLIWIAGFLISLGRLFYGMAFLSGFRSSLVRIAEDELSCVLEAVQSEFPRTKLPSVYMSPAIDSPVALGCLRPMIVLPQSLCHDLSAEELTGILIHEVAHIYHRDQAVGLLQRWMTAFYWWNPLAYALSAAFSVTREDISDNYAIQKNGAHSYAKCLVSLAQKTSLVTRLPSAIGMATPHISLEDRIRGIVSKERVTVTKLSKPVALILALSALLFTSVMGRYSWTLMAEENTEREFTLPAGMEPVSLVADKDRIYIGEEENFPYKPESHIAVFSAADFSLLAKIGWEGKGVGEFLIMGPSRFQVADGQIWAQDLRKFVLFSLDGVFQKEISIPRGMFLSLYPLVPVGDNFVTFASDWMDIDKGNNRAFGRLFDSELRQVREFYEELPLPDPPPPPIPPPPQRNQTDAKAEQAPIVKKDYQAIPDCIDFAVAEDKIYVADTRKGFHIAVFDSLGTPLYEINKDYVPLPVPPDYKAALMNKLQRTQGWLNQVANIKFRDSFPAFYSYKIADGKIYVSTYAEKDGLHELVVMNLKGDVLKRSFAFPLGPSYESMYNNFCVAKDQYAILSDNIYYLVKNKTNGSYGLRIRNLR
jgi:beta-lactamase regulating signal transducer with metallopeptidase domain